MLYFLGFDVSKAKLDVSLINERGIEEWADKIPNETVAVATLLLTVAGNYPGDELCCVVEATGCYHRPVLEGATAADVPCRIYNPILTKQQIKGSVRGQKTDRNDAFLVARVGWSGSARLYSPEPYMVTKHYARSCQKLSILSTLFKLHSAHLVEQLGGELSNVTKELLNSIQNAILAAKQQLYKDLAMSAKGRVFGLLQTIPGIGPYIAGSLIGEIQNMERFKTAHALTAYAGLDPKIRQSGKSLNSTGRLTKRGSSSLRRSLFIAANIARRYDPNFKALYDKKRGEGKSHTVAVCAVARKLLAIIRSVWLSDKTYDVDFATRG